MEMECAARRTVRTMTKWTRRCLPARRFDLAKPGLLCLSTTGGRREMDGCYRVVLVLDSCQYD
ncbi:hypothetical protein BDA96_03G089800 [Sorghum bicolor]|uniref:Uncharacterized protein n=1 Tax=Sorghum bicolor TaxID=4558 RepID=A0A921UP75_SORBI|nr:hypothetical protein BDA96_03G089800 [Sorghum bicolor]